VTTCGGGLLLGNFGGGDQGIELLLEGLGVGGRKGANVRWHGDQRWRRVNSAQTVVV
jgi:hypothetical protein